MAEIETEIKLTVSEADYHRLRRRGEVLECRDQLNVYLHDPTRLQEGLGYLRVRFETGRAPMVTLKIPVSWEGGVRKMVEMEEPLETMGPGLFPRPMRRVTVADALSGEMAGHFQELGIDRLRRLGWMRNRRCVLALGRAGEVELDRTLLPGGMIRCEVEIETDDEEHRDALVSLVREWAPSATISRLGKFSRFLEAMDAEHGGPERGGSIPS